jgi:uncharacterized protein YbjT (DUF2867 family)
MRILLLGAGGFIGRHILAELLGAGHEVVGVARSTKALHAGFPQAAFAALDLARAVRAEDWSDLLAEVDVIVNAAGLLRGPDMHAVHVAMPRALYEAATKAGIKRAVLISAISARDDVYTDYSVSKLAGEAALQSSVLDWIILRPSLVYAEGSYGGTSLMRGMAGLPLFVPLPGSGDFAFSPIHVRDLSHTVRIACEGGLAFHQTLEPVGPETVSLRDLLLRYRTWLGFGPARFVHIPMAFMRLLAWIGDRVGNGPISSNSLAQMVAGNAGNSDAFAKAVGFMPRSLGVALRDSPAQVQDRWHAKLFFLAPLLQVVLCAMWLASALLGFAYGAETTQAIVERLGIPIGWTDPLRIGSSLLDVAVATQLLFDRSAMRTAVVQLAVVFCYTVVIGLTLPELWLEPLGPLLKNLPILMAIAIYGVIGNKH